jgi:CO/xanthine dehydrogenase Mo-binding subunit
VVTGTWELGRQDPGFLGLESALAVPGPDGGVTIHTATQDVFIDRAMVAMQLGLDPELVRITQSGMGGAFGGRERITLQAHVALAALRLGRPVKATYRRPESFAAHAKRHPARITLTLGARRDGELLFVEGKALLDGGAYGPAASSAVLGATCYYLAGPYRVPAVRITGDAVYTNNPVSGAMRGFGAPQACFAVESAMDLLATELGMNPVELRRRNALRPGDAFPTSGQLVPAWSPVAEVIDACAALPLPAPDVAPAAGLRGRIRRGVGFAVGAKHAMYGEGEPEWSVASVRVDHGGATVRTSAAECGQGLLGVLTQIATETLGGMPVAVPDGSTDDGYAGASSASRQTWMSGSAVRQAAEDAAAQLRERAARYFGTDPAQVRVIDGELRAPGRRASLKDVLGSDVIEATATYHAPPTERGDPVTGAGNVHVSWMFVAHRAVVDVDELGQVAVRQIATAQDVGVALNPREVRGQLIGGTVQGMGLALMEDLQAPDGEIVNGSFTGYLMPTAVDAPPVLTALVEVAEPRGPFGAKGVGEPPAVSSTPAVAAAIRAATGRGLTRVPVRPWDCIPCQPDLSPPEPSAPGLEQPGLEQPGAGHQEAS